MRDLSSVMPHDDGWRGRMSGSKDVQLRAEWFARIASSIDV